MNNLENAAECARRAMVFYEEDDQESLGTALRMLYAYLMSSEETKKDPDVRSGSKEVGSRDDEYEAIKPWQVY